MTSGWRRRAFDPAANLTRGLVSVSEPVPLGRELSDPGAKEILRKAE